MAVDVLLLVAAGLAAGVVNAVAGGGTFFTFGALMAVGLPPVVANATSAVSVLPGQIMSTIAYRREIAALGQRVVPLAIVSAIGGAFGGWLLLRSGDTTFRLLVPWLLLAATLLFAASPVISARLLPALASGKPHSNRVTTALTIALQALVAVYGGYFGAGMGIMMLATLSLTYGDRFHEANAAKNILAVLMQGLAVVLFAGSGVVAWKEAAIVTVASIAGGWWGVGLGRRIPLALIRLCVVGAGLGLAAVYFVR
jgi:uncharacterized membrane protein YfcA